MRLVLVLPALIACADPTSVRVRLLADEDVQARAHTLSVSVQGVDGERSERSVRVGVDGNFPFEVPVVPRGGDADRSFELVAELQDEAGQSLGVQRVLTAFDAGRERVVERVFQGSCANVRCAEGRTCLSGTCEDACVQSEGPLPALCSGNACEERGFVSANFDDVTDFSACPDFDSSDRAVCLSLRGEGSAEVVEPVNVPPPPCGGRVLRLETAESGSSAAHLALPVDEGPRWMRAMVYAPMSSREALARFPARNQALMRWSSGGNVAFPATAVNFRWNDGGSFVQWVRSEPLSQDTSGDLFEVPVDRWTCLEFGIDLAQNRVEVALDGEVLAPIVSDIALLFEGEGLYAHIGLFSGVVPTTLFVDDVVVSDERIPCP